MVYELTILRILNLGAEESMLARWYYQLDEFVSSDFTLHSRTHTWRSAGCSGHVSRKALVLSPRSFNKGLIALICAGYDPRYISTLSSPVSEGEVKRSRLLQLEPTVIASPEDGGCSLWEDIARHQIYSFYYPTRTIQGVLSGKNAKVPWLSGT